MTLGVLPQKNNRYALRILGSCGELLQRNFYGYRN